MRLFYDQCSSKPRGEALLIAADILALTSAILFATGAARAVTTQPWDVATLVLWASIPRAVARLLAFLDRPSHGYGAYSLSLGLAIVTAVLIVAGWQTLESLARGGPPLEISSALPIFLAWSSGMALFHSRAYRLHDFLLWSVILVGLKDAREYPHLWLPIFFGAVFLSSTVRHLLNDAFPGVKRPLLNLQNARTTAMLGTLAASVAFWAVYAPLHGGLDYALGPAAGLLEGSPARLGVELSESDAAKGEAKSVGARSAMRMVEDAAKSGETKRTVGFTYKVALRDLSLARFDPREVLRVKLAGGEHAWIPEPGMHWKAISFSRYSAPDESWAEDTEYSRSRWPSKSHLRRETPQSTQLASGVRLECRFVTPILRSLPLPYFTTRVESHSFHEYRDNGLGDVFPYPPPTRSTKYTVQASLGEASAFPKKVISGRHPEARHLELPPARELGLNLESYGSSIFESAGEGIAAKVERLRQHFRKDFKYSNNAVWRTNQNALAVFLQKEKIGNCTYFATATALLLRTAGISTRLAAGFSGSRWDEDTGEAVLLNQTAHAWTEVYFPGEGWHPIDATAWVPNDPTYKAPDDAVELMRDMLRRSAQPEESMLESPPERPPPLPPSTARTRDDGSRVRDSEDPEREVTGELPEGIETDPDNTGSWIEYAGEIDGSQRRGAAGEDADVVDGGIGDEIDPGAPKGSPSELEDNDGADDTESQAGPAWDLARLRTAFRAAIVAVGLGIVGLLVATFIRRKSAAEDDDAADADSGEEAKAPAEAVWLGALGETEPAERLIAEYCRLQLALERTRAHRRAHQTPIEHGKAVTRGRNDVEAAFEELHEVLYALLYGQEDVDAKRIEVGIQSARKLRRLLG